MKILILGHYEIASNYAIGLIVEKLQQHDLTIMLSGKGDAFEDDGNEFSRLAQYEQSLSEQLNQDIDELNLECMSFERLTELTGKPIELLKNPNSVYGLSKLADIAPDLIISIRYRKILKQAAIDIPKFGIINLHSGLLPQYRGAMATFWAMLKGDKIIGTTLHYITDGTIDTGSIIATSEIPVDFSQSYLHNVLNLYPHGCRNILSAVEQIDQSEFAASQQQMSDGCYYSFPKSVDLGRFLALGLKLF